MTSKASFGPASFGSGSMRPAALAGPGIRNWFCLCCNTCTYFFDGFERDDNTDLDVNWAEEAGDWGILDRRLVTSSSNAFVKCLAGQLDGKNLDDSHVVSALLRGTAVGDEIWLISSYLDVNNYWCARFVAGQPSTLELWQVVGGDKIQHGDTVYLAAYRTEPDKYDGLDRAVPVAIIFGTLGICLWYGRPSQNVYERPIDPLPVIEAVTVPTGSITDNTCGIATGPSNTGPIYVDDFRLQFHGEEVQDCARCHPMPSCVRVTVSGITPQQHDYPCQLPPGTKICNCLNETYYLGLYPYGGIGDDPSWSGVGVGIQFYNYGSIPCVGYNPGITAVGDASSYTIIFGGPWGARLESDPIDPSVPYWSWNEEPLTLVPGTLSSGANCNASGITATVTAVHGHTCPKPYPPCWLCTDCGDVEDIEMVMTVSLRDYPIGVYGYAFSDLNGTYFIQHAGAVGVDGSYPGCIWSGWFGGGVGGGRVSLAWRTYSPGAPAGVAGISLDWGLRGRVRTWGPGGFGAGYFDASLGSPIPSTRDPYLGASALSCAAISASVPVFTYADPRAPWGAGSRPVEIGIVSISGVNVGG